ncbi:MAG: glycoside hydrolase family 20 zincin-like fold domain-containing protein, partial [Armatimonadota bacterium]|nr:glycoside hydrolase family 20 zincin-like fold domain-containing protein [Armatimonadota bacterium]
ALVIPGNLLAGAAYQATLADGTAAVGRAPLVPRAGIGVLPPFRSVTLRTWAGTLRIAVEEGAPVVLTDRRANRFDDQRCFWVGAQGVPVTPEQPFRHVMTLSFDPQTLPGPSPLPTGGTAAAPVQVDAVKEAEFHTLPLLPPVQERRDGEGVYLPARGDVLWVAPGRGEAHRRLERAARRLLLERMNLPLQVAATRRRPRRGITVEVIGPNTQLPPGTNVPQQAEGYWLRVNEAGVRIVGRDARGAFYGLQTLRFLLRKGEIPATEIRDWPDFPIRGLHLLADDASLAFHGRIIQELMAPLKMNHIVFEVEYAGWDATRPLHQPWRMSKADMRALLELARDHFIEVTPLVQTLGHCEWLFANGQNADWAEDVESRYAYDASNPAVYAFLDKLLAEVVDLFHPRFLHIGHDEVDMRGRYPARPANVAKGAHQLVLDDILWFHQWAKRRGIRLMMWHDMLLTKAEGNVAHGGPPLNMAAIRPRLPRDIVLVDWQYSALDAYPEIPLLRSEGFAVIGATWYHPGNIEKMATYARDKEVLGMINTTWTGYHGNATALVQHHAQIAAYVRAGDRFWNAGAPERPAYEDGDVLSALMPVEEREPLARAGRGRVLDIAPWANVSLAEGADPFGLGDALGLAVLPEGTQRYGRYLF